MLTEDIYVSAPWAEILDTHAIAYTPDANWEDLQKHGVAVNFEEERPAPYNLFLTFRSSFGHFYTLYATDHLLTLLFQALQAAVQRIHGYVSEMENKMVALEKKK